MPDHVRTAWVDLERPPFEESVRLFNGAAMFLDLILEPDAAETAIGDLAEMVWLLVQVGWACLRPHHGRLRPLHEGARGEVNAALLFWGRRDAERDELRPRRRRHARRGQAPRPWPLCGRRTYASSPAGRRRPICGDACRRCKASSVVLDLVQPVRAGGRPLDEERLTREDETGRRGPPRRPERGTPQHAAVCRRRMNEAQFGSHRG
jgi:hypothetical protein